ncbi:hypothetical protein ABKV19_014095 [Rosa sericea]
MKKTGNEQKQQKRQPQQLGKRQPPPPELQQPEPSQQKIKTKLKRGCCISLMSIWTNLPLQNLLKIR